ncbi:dihydrofolate reductase [Saccharospirillum sp. MSK14-1]|uniref:dihydrofolate reductase n=1 Tax=Saccharospirillum sp. MSK14-1 TaxID=1897632 RepID=UPI000D37FAEA|nr:dihydrofolate reductase [Saccharospirillum sp. MSK14-1]PTY37486.1 dihydrofolate reductase [Saccharospirillum sp. MSK14-1]
MRIAMIWAMSENRVIGRDNKLPWYLPNDLKYFKQVTSGKPVIMGRKTYDSIGRPLPNRTNIVISRDTGFRAEGCQVVHSLDEALELAGAQLAVNGGDEVIVMGGAQIYAEALPRADRLYVTQVHATVEGDAFFPTIDFNAWQEQGREDFSAEGPNPYDYSFVVYDRPALNG